MDMDFVQGPCGRSRGHGAHSKLSSKIHSPWSAVLSLQHRPSLQVLSWWALLCRKNIQTSSTLIFFFLLSPYKKKNAFIEYSQGSPCLSLSLTCFWKKRNKIHQWLFLLVLHYSNLEYFVEILHWTGNFSLSPEGISNVLIYMLKKDLCSTWTMASKIVAALQYKRCIALRECSAVNLMTSMTFSNEMRKIIRSMHCPLSPQPQSYPCLGESCSCTYFPCSNCCLTQKMTLKTEPG